MKSYLKLVVLTIILLYGCVDKPTQITTLGSVSGRVVDQSNVSYLSGVTVRIQDVGNRTTDNNGFYEFRDLSEGVYTITAEKAGYVTESEQVVIEANKHKEVNFSLRTAQPAQLIVSPTSLNFGQIVNSLNISVNNGGDEALSWQVSSDSSWLTTFPTTGITTTQTSQITVTVNRGGLAVGNYTGNLSFTSDGGNFNVPVSMEVTPVVLSVEPLFLSFGVQDTELTFTISNSGYGELNWSLSSNQGWLSATPASGSLVNSSESITVVVDRSGLSANTYYGQINIESNAGNQTVDIEMVVPEGPAPFLDVSTNILDFGSHEDNMSFSILNTGDSVLNWNVSENQNWIAVYPTNGSTNPGGSSNVNVSVNRTGLSHGLYNGMINVNSNGGDASVEILMSIPYFETFENLNNWDYEGWEIDYTNWSGWEAPTVKLMVYGYDGSGPNYLSTNVDVVSGQKLSFKLRVYQGNSTSSNPYLQLYINNVLIETWFYYWDLYNPSIPIETNGQINIKFVGYTDTHNYLSTIRIDDIKIE